jgi:hypothetical protein
VVVVAACKNKHLQLLLAADSWLSVRGVERVVLVDWGSAPALSSALPHHILASPRLSLVTLRGPPTFKLTWAYNLAALLAPPGATLLKLDCDTAVASDFVEAHPLALGEYYAGDWRAARDANDAHLNGVFYAAGADFRRVGGYDERIQTYGWDDTDLYLRLNASGLARRALSPGRLHHLYHADEERTQLLSSTNPCPIYEMALNRLLCGGLPPWDATMPRAQYDLFGVEAGGSDQGGAAPVTAALRSGTAPPALRHMATPAQLAAAQAEAALEAASQLEGFRMDDVIAELPAEYQARLIASYYLAVRLSPARTLLIVHLQHGLANRMRTLASAVALAAASGRWLRVVSLRDAHFGGDLSDVLDLQASGLTDVWSEFDYRELSNLMVDSYDYMDPNVKGRLIEESSMKHIYVRSAYRLNSSIVSMDQEDAALRALVPSRQAAALAAGVEVPAGAALLGVHVRHADPRIELPGIKRSEYPEADWPPLEAARAAAGAAPFLAEMRRRRREHARAGGKGGELVFFVAADDPGMAQRLATESERALYLDRAGCVDRSARCLRYAMADLLVLGRAQVVLGSALSSFTEVAGRLAGVRPAVAGEDFGAAPGGQGG